MSTSARCKYGLIQIEPTSRCTLRCITCLRDSHPGQWQERDLSPAVLDRLLGDLKQARVVHLQGWGEPLLSDSFLSLIAVLKNAGCHVSFTTNGTIMDQQLALGLVRSGVDAVTFSMAGANAGVQDPLRGRQSFARLASSLATLVAVRKELASSTPVLGVSYLLTPVTIGQLPQAVSWCGSQGVSLLAGVHLTHAANRRQEDLRLFPVRSRKIIYRVRWARLRALLAGVRLEIPPLTPQLIPICSKDPVNNLSVAADGAVAPCVFLNAPLTGRVPWLKQGNTVGSTPFTFGNIRRNSLETIWNGEEYKKFRHCFEQRVVFYQKALARVGYDLDGMEQLDRARQAIRRYFAAHPPPEPCRGCLKLEGY